MNYGEFVEKSVVITGGAQGIGRCLVETFCRERAKVYFADSSEKAGSHLEAALKETGAEVKFIPTDLGDEDSIRKFGKQVVDRGEGLALLVNNVGTTGFGHHFATRPLEEWNQMLAVGLTSHFLCSQIFAPLLTKAGGSIVNIASTRGLMSEPNTEPYSASKGGIIALTHSLAITLGEKHIRVNCISPGWIDVTEWQFPARKEKLTEAAHRQHPVGRVGKPEDIAEACLFLASPRRAGFITGQNLVVDGGMVRKMIYDE